MLDEATATLRTIETSDRFGRFDIAPLDAGFGITIGNALRRVLLTSLEGAAVTWIKIRAVPLEFTDVPNANEDVTEVVLNVKQLRLRSHSDQAVLMHLTVQREGPVYASDIDAPSTIEIINPDQHLVTLANDDKEFDMELTVERGKGYEPADSRSSDEIGMIPVDAIYSPVVKVNFTVEPTRNQRNVAADRLVMDVWTDGTLAPEEALTRAAEILVNHFAVLGGAGRFAGMITDKPAASNAIEIPQTIANTPIEELELSVRTYNCLKRSNITKIGQVLNMTEDELLAVRHFGKRSLSELIDRLALRSTGNTIADDLGEESEE